ncbi:MAG: hypothetical protein EPN26_01535 [Rhodospirillales bacterium]|nr:MAG: hypothetical protein EPN26_01535 [Rhodospirillales bacterium]
MLAWFRAKEPRGGDRPLKARVDIYYMKILFWLLVASWFSVACSAFGPVSLIPEVDEAGSGSISWFLTLAREFRLHGLVFWTNAGNGGFSPLVNPYMFNGLILPAIFLPDWLAYAIDLIACRMLFGFFMFRLTVDRLGVRPDYALVLAAGSIFSSVAWGESEAVRLFPGVTFWGMPGAIWVVTGTKWPALRYGTLALAAGLLYGFFSSSLIYSYNFFVVLWLWPLVVREKGPFSWAELKRYYTGAALFSLGTLAFSLPVFLAAMESGSELGRIQAQRIYLQGIDNLKDRLFDAIVQFAQSSKILTVYLLPVATVAAFPNSLKDRRFTGLFCLLIGLLLLQTAQYALFRHIPGLQSFHARTSLVELFVLCTLNADAIRLLVQQAARKTRADFVLFGFGLATLALLTAGVVRENFSGVMHALQGQNSFNLYHHPTLERLAQAPDSRQPQIAAYFPAFTTVSPKFAAGRGVQVFSVTAPTTYGLSSLNAPVGLWSWRARQYMMAATPWIYGSKVPVMLADSLDMTCPGTWPQLSYGNRYARLLRHAGVSRIVATAPLRVDEFELTNAEEVEIRRSHLCESGFAKMKTPDKMFTTIYVYETGADIAPFAFVAGRVVAAKGSEETLERLATDVSLVPGKSAVIEQEERPPLSCAGGTVELTGQGDEVSAIVSVSGTCLVVFRQNFDPGWSAWIDGDSVSIQRVNSTFQGVWVPTGSHKIKLKYRPF